MTTSPRTSRAVVIGGGLVGSLVALRLADAGVEVRVLERSVPGAEASSAAAGILAAQAEAKAPGALFDLAMESRTLHARLAEELRGRVGLDVGYRRAGVLDVAATEEEAHHFTERARWQKERGLPVELLDAESLRAREPGLAHDLTHGALFPDDGVVDPPRLVAGVTQAAARAGAVFRIGVTVRRIVIENGRARGVETEDGLIEGDAVIVCAGAWSGLVEGALADSSSVRPARGQVIELETRPVPIDSVVFARGGYVVPRADGHVYVGSTLEFVGFRRGVTVDGMARLVGIASRSVPSLGDAVISRSWSNFRPYTSDTVPFVGTRGVEGLVVATGHHRSGILLAPVTAEIVRELVTTGASTRPITALSPTR